MSKFPPRTLAEQECLGLLAAAKTPRDKAMIVLLWRAGLRCAEACALVWSDIEMVASGARIHVRHGKGDKSRYVALDAKSMDIVLASGGKRFVLETGTGRAVDTSHVRRRIKVLAKTAGIRGRVHPHGLRHTFARNLHDEGVSVRSIQVALGHSSLAQTDTYLRSLGCDEAVALLLERSW